MLQNEIITSGSSTILKEIGQQELYKTKTSTSSSPGLNLSKGTNLKYVSSLENAFEAMTVNQAGSVNDNPTSATSSNDEDAGGGKTENVDKAKELYQSMMEAVRQLEATTSKVNSVEGLFNKEILEHRRKLKTACEKLLFEAPEKYGVVARDRMWRSVFYEVIGRARRFKKTPSFTPIQQIFVKNHLLSGVGQLNYLLMKLQTLPEFERANFNIMPNSGTISLQNDVMLNNTKMSEGAEDTKEEDSAPNAEKWLIDIVYMCLINTGDLYRYLSDIFQKDSDAHSEYFHHALSYYSNAFLLNPASGLAHNQLGNLSSKLNDGLDSTYYLLYSMCSANAYDGAYPNLKQLLDGQLVHLATMPAVKELKPIDLFAHTFLGLIYHLICTDGTHLHNFEKSCQEALLAFHELLNSSETKPEKEVYFRVAVISIMAVWRLQAIESMYVSTAVAFASGLFLNLTNNLNGILKAKCTLAPIQKTVDLKETLINLESQSADIEEELSGFENFKEVDDKNVEAEAESKTGCEVIKVAKRRRQRGRHVHRVITEDPYSSSSDEEEDSCNDDDSDGRSDLLMSDSSSYERDSSEDEPDSDAEENANGARSNGTDGDGYEESISSNDLSDGSSLKKASETTSEQDEAGKEKLQMILSMDDLLNSFEEIEPVVVAMIPYIRWFKSAPLIVTAFISNCGPDFMQNICDVMNIISTIDWNPLGNDTKTDKTTTQLFRCWQSFINPKEQNENKIHDFLFELLEDRSMLGLPEFTENLRKLKRNLDLSASEVAMIRIGRILAFGHWIASLDGVSLQYSKELGKFKVESVKNQKYYNQARRLRRLRDKLEQESGNVNDDLKNSWRRDRRRRNREGEGRKGPFPGGRVNRRNRSDDPNRQISSDETVYILCDLPVMLYHFDIIRRLAMYSKFLIVIPHSVHKTLDRLKDSEEKGSREARIAAMWVEEQNGRGAITMLRRTDKLKLDFDYPEPHCDAAWEFIDVLEACNHFRIRENKLGRPAAKFFDDVRDKYRVLYLSGHLDLLKPKYETEFNAREIAHRAHIFVDRITFYVENQGRRIRKRKRKGKGNG